MCKSDLGRMILGRRDARLITSHHGRLGSSVVACTVRYLVSQSCRPELVSQPTLSVSASGLQSERV